MRKTYALLLTLGILFICAMVFNFETKPLPRSFPVNVTSTSTYEQNENSQHPSTSPISSEATSTDRILSISSLSPFEGPTGNTIAIIGSGFSKTTNRINFAGKNNVLVAVRSSDGRNIQFTIPATPCSLGDICAQSVLKPGTYPISVSNEFGTSNKLLFTVTAAMTNKTLILGLEQTGNVEDVAITPLRIIEDSRCPIGVFCIQAGRVVVETRVATTNSIATTSLEASNDQVFKTNDGHEIKITEISPLKKRGVTIANEDYRVTYQVVK